MNAADNNHNYLLITQTADKMITEKIIMNTQICTYNLFELLMC